MRPPYSPATEPGLTGAFILGSGNGHYPGAMRAIVHALTLAAAILAWTPAFADNDHDRARKALEAGEILPLREILARAEKAFPGQMIEAELETERGGAMIYEIKMLTSDGRVAKLIYDARTGDLLASRMRERQR